MARRLCLTMKELKKIKVIEQVVRKKMKGVEAAIVLGYSEVHISRLKKQYLKHGADGLIRKSRSSNRKVPDEMREKIACIYKSLYEGFNILHYCDKLKEEHNIDYCYETVRQIMIEKGLHKPKKRKRTHRKRRQRMKSEGMLVQMDSSLHRWIHSIPEKHWLISTVDDATGKILYAKFFKEDNMFNNMHVIRKVIENNGIFLSLYTDRASHFKTTRRGGLHNDVNIEQDDTNIQKALNDLNITLIIANSPQAKGRIERSYRTLQDRLIKEMELRNITDYEDANKFLETFIDYYNNKWSKKAREGNIYEKLPKDTDLDVIFTKRISRKVRNDYTVSYKCHKIQIPPVNKQLQRSVVDLHLTDYGKIYILYKGKLIHECWLKKKFRKSVRTEKINKILANRSFNYGR